METEKLFDEDDVIFLLENIDDVINLFKYVHDELKVKYKNLDRCDMKRLFKTENNYKLFMLDSNYTFLNGYCYFLASLINDLIPNFKLVGLNNGKHVFLENHDNYIDIRGNIRKNKPFWYFYNKDDFIYVDDKYLDYVRRRYPSFTKALYNEFKYELYKNLKEYLKVTKEYNKYILSKHN